MDENLRRLQLSKAFEIIENGLSKLMRVSLIKELINKLSSAPLLWD